MTSQDLFGWDLLYCTIENKITKEEDVIIALAHWFFTKTFDFRCVGIGDDKTLNKNEVGSELLPEGWNDSEKNYALRYVTNGNLYILLGVKTEGSLILNLLDVKSRNVSNMALNSKETVKALKGSLQTMIPQTSHILDRYRKELVEPVYNGSTREVTTQTTNPEPEFSGRHNVSPPRLPDQQFGPGNLFSLPGERDPLRDIGRGDLDPLGRGGGGMLFSPPNPPFGIGIPRRPGGAGSFGLRFPPPPGARFDPFGPPDPDRNRANPNPDHFRPPPDFDDMYM